MSNTGCDFLVDGITGMPKIALAALASLLAANVHAQHLDLIGDAHRAILESLPEHTFGSDEVVVADLRIQHSSSFCVDVDLCHLCTPERIVVYLA